MNHKFFFYWVPQFCSFVCFKKRFVIAFCLFWFFICCHHTVARLKWHSDLWHNIDYFENIIFHVVSNSLLIITKHWLTLTRLTSGALARFGGWWPPPPHWKSAMSCIYFIKLYLKSKLTLNRVQWWLFQFSTLHYS